MLLKLDIKVHLEVAGDIEHTDIPTGPNRKSALLTLIEPSHESNMLTVYFTGFRFGKGRAYLD